MNLDVADEFHRALHHRDTDARACFVAAVGQDSTLNCTKVDVHEVDEGHSTQAVKGGAYLLGTPQGWLLRPAADQGLEVLEVKGTPAADINASIDIMKKTVHEGGKTGINTFIIDSTEHAHVGGDGVGTITVVTEFMLIGNEALAGEVGKLDFAAADETGEGPQRIEVKAGSGKAAVFLKLGGTFYCKL